MTLTIRRLVVLAVLPFGALLTQEPLRRAAITGRVIDERTSAPIAGAVVALSVQGGSASDPADRVIADAKGRFVFVGLDPSFRFALSASKPGWFDGNYLAASGSVIFTVTEGQLFSADIALTPVSAISGSFRDEYGEPVVAGLVTALRRVLVSGNLQLLAVSSGVTDDRGDFRLTGLTTGAFYVAGRRPQVSPTGPSGVTEIGQTVFWPQTNDLHDAAPILLGVGEERLAIDIRTVSSPSFSISGTASGNVPPGSSVYLFPDVGVRVGLDLAIAETTLSGPSFRFRGVPPGRYRLLASSSVTRYSYQEGNGVLSRSPAPVNGLVLTQGGFLTSAAPASVRYEAFGPPPDQASSWFGEVSVVVSDRDVGNVELAIQRGTSLSGKVQGENGSEWDRPIEVYAEPADGRSIPGLLKATVAGGRFRVTGLFPGKYFVRVGRATGQTVRSIKWSGGESVSSPLEVAVGQESIDSSIVMTTQVARISGTVTRGADLPSRVSVLLFPCDAAAASDFGVTSPLFRAVQTVSGGQFRLSDLASGDYCLTAVSTREVLDWPSREVVEALLPNAKRLSLRDSDAQTIDIPVSRIR